MILITEQQRQRRQFPFVSSFGSIHLFDLFLFHSVSPQQIGLAIVSRRNSFQERSFSRPPPFTSFLLVSLVFVLHLFPFHAPFIANEGDQSKGRGKKPNKSAATNHDTFRLLGSLLEDNSMHLQFISPQSSSRDFWPHPPRTKSFIFSVLCCLGCSRRL